MVIGTLAALCAPAAASAAQTTPAVTPAISSASLSIDRHRPLVKIPQSFLGLSTEYWTLPVDEHHVALYERMLTLLHVRGDGPFILRIGGDSASHTLYDPNLLEPPRWAFELTPSFIERTASIVKALRLRVILDLNLVTGSPQLAAAWARVAETRLPRKSIIGFEIANEPDLYDRAFWLYTTGGEQFSGRALPPDITPLDYARDFNRYAAILGRVVPGVPLLAPALANPVADRRFIEVLLAGPHPGLGEVSGHRYPYSGCALRDSPQYPTFERILSERASARPAALLRPVVEFVRRHAGLPFRLTEFNSITCGGLSGVSNSFSTALWAPDAVFEYVRAGVRGVNLHARVRAINDPFTFDARGLVVRPLLYGLILFARTLGPDARLVPTRLHATTPQLKAWTVAVGKRTLHVLLLNKGPTVARVAMTLPSRSRATLERLLGASPAAQTGETLGGRSLTSQGRWSGHALSEVVRPRAGSYAVALPPYSAALVALQAASAP
jgi:hypothetical protein